MSSRVSADNVVQRCRPSSAVKSTAAVGMRTIAAHGSGLTVIKRPVSCKCSHSPTGV